MSDRPAKPECDFYARTSPENAACAWCERYRINLDREGRLCRRCKSEDAFRRQLEQQYEIRFGVACTGGTSYCERFDTVTDDAQCERCQSDPLFRAFLFGQMQTRRAMARAERVDGCRHRGAVVRHELRGCCGNAKKTIPVYECAVHGEAHEGRCVECEQWEAR